MTTPLNGPISLNDLKAEFGGPASPALFNYYAGGSYVPASVAGIPTSGAISLFQLYNKTKTFPVQYFTPGTYTVTVPASTNIMALYLRGGSGGGGGGGGAGEYGWGPSASGAGGGGGGGGQDISGAFAVTPGSTLTIVVGNGGAGGAGGSGAFQGDRYNGFAGAVGGSGASTYIAGIVSAAGGSGGQPGQGAPGDNVNAIVSGGNSGAGYGPTNYNGAGLPGQYAHIIGNYLLGQFSQVYMSGCGGAYFIDYGHPNFEAGAGGAGGGSSGVGGNGGTGGNWNSATVGVFAPDRIGKNGAAGASGYLVLQFGTTSPLITASNYLYSGSAISTAPPFEPNYNPGCVGGVCFPAGSKVLMGDYSWKVIEDIKLTDLVMGANGPEPITEIHTPLLNDRKLLKFADNSLSWSEEHAIWAKQNDKQWWWSANAPKWKAEVQAKLFEGLTDNDSILEGTVGTEWAHLSGWKSEDIEIVNDAVFNTQLYLPMTSGSPIIVDGYLVEAGTNQANFDYSALDWDKIRNSLNEVLSKSK